MLNLQKTVYINFHARRPISESMIGDHILSQETNFLGIRIDNRLTFESHVDHVCQCLNRAYFALMKLKGSLDHDSMLNAYYALCHSRLAYGCLLWGRARDWHRVFVSQKRIVRLLFGLTFRESCRDYFRQHSILTLPGIYNILKAVMYIKQNIDDFPRHDQPYNTRHQGLPLTQHRTTLFQKSPHFDFVKLYNKLPEAVSSISNHNAFKKKVKSILIRGCYYSQQEYLDDSL